MTSVGNLVSNGNPNLFQFVGRKLLFDLIQKTKNYEGLNQDLFLSVITRFLLKMTSREGKVTQKALEKDFLTSIRNIKSKMLKKKLIEEFRFAMGFILEDDTESKTSWKVGPPIGGNGEKKTSASDSDSGSDSGSDSDSDSDDDDSDSSSRSGSSSEDVEMDSPKKPRGQKRKRETTEEDVADERKEAKKAKRDFQEVAVDSGGEDMFSLLPEDIWPEVFIRLPSMRELLKARLVNKQWLSVIKRLILREYFFLLLRSEKLMKRFLDVPELFPPSLDLSYNNEISAKTLSKLIYLRSLDLTESNYDTARNGVATLTNLRKLTTGNTSLKVVLSLNNLEELTCGREKYGRESFEQQREWKLMKELIRKEGVPGFQKKLGGPGNLSKIKILRDHTYSKVIPMLSSEFTSLVELKAHRKWDSTSLGTLTNLTSLTMVHCKIKDEDLNRLTNLTHLDMTHVPVTNEGLKSLINLESLKISFPEKITGDIFKNPSKIKTLHLNYIPGISDDHIKNLENLTDLSLTNCKHITGDCFLPIRKQGKIIEKSLSSLSMKQMHTSSFDSSKLQFLIPSLTRFHTDNVNVVLEDVASLTNLTELEIHETQNLYGRRFGDDIHAPLWKKLVNLKTLHIIGSDTLRRNSGLVSANDETLTSILLSFQDLTSLKVHHSRSLTDECVEKLTNCTSLDLSDCLLVTSKSISKLQQLTKLSWRPVRNESWDVDYSLLSSLVNLTQIDLPSYYFRQGITQPLPKVVMEKKKGLLSHLLRLNGESQYYLTKNV